MVRVGWRRTLVAVLLVLGFFLVLVGEAVAADWYVMAGAKRGKGTKEAPFKGIYKATDKATSGDVIHVVQGTYHGKLKCGYVVIDKPGLTVVGGYKDGTFAERNPFLYPTTIKAHPKAKGSKFAGGYFRTKKGGKPTKHESTTIDGFWFDRKEENSYSVDGNLGVPLGSNTKPVIWFQEPDCHIRNCVFLNTALYAVRITGDENSIENCLFVNSNYCAVDLYGKSRKIGKGYPFNKMKIAHCTFFSMWNAVSLEEAAGSAIMHNGGAQVEITDNIFHLSSGNNASKGWALKDVRNFKGDQWITFNRNSVSQMRGGIYIFYDPDQTATIGIWEDIADLEETNMAEAVDNDQENPFYDLDKEWFARYVSVIPHEDVSNKKVKMDDYNKMARLLGKPLQDVPRKMGKNMGVWYPVEHVKTGAFWKPTNEKVKKRGVQAAGPFPIVRGKLLGPATPAGEAAAEAPKRDYQEVDWDTLWTTGEKLVDKPIKLKCYYMKWDASYGAGFGKKAKPYLPGADKTTHKILALREVPEMDKGSHTIKGFMRMGSAAANYVEKRAKRSGGRGECNFSFVVYGVVKKAGAKLFGKVPQIIIEIDTIKKK
jgi:hypothetical protein